MARKTKTTPAGAAAAAIESAAADKVRAVDETPADADFAVAVGEAETAAADDATAATDGTEVDRANLRPSEEEGDAGASRADASDQRADAEASASGDAETATADDTTAATDGTEVDRANPRPSEEESDAGSGETDASDQQADGEGPAPDAEGVEHGEGGETPAFVPEGHVAILFQRDHVIDDGLQGTLRETRFKKGARHVMSLASARHFTSRGIAVEI